MASGNLPGDSRAYQVQVPCIVFFVVTTFVITARLWARIKLRSWSGIGLDDGTIVTSWVFATTVSALMMASCSYGFGQHIRNLTAHNKLMTLKLFYVAQAFYKLTINLTKVSILLLYLRIFIKRWFRITCFTLLGFILCYMVATFGASIWQCHPIARAWDKSIPGTCINMSANWHANSGFSIATDIIILALPMHPIYTSMLPRGQKVALIVVFALGVFTTITSILRLSTLDFSIKSPDMTYDIDSSIWAMIEQNLAIICACLPTCRLPLAYAFPAYFSSTDTAKRLAATDGSGLGSNDRNSCATPFPSGKQWHNAHHDDNQQEKPGAQTVEAVTADGTHTHSHTRGPSASTLGSVGWDGPDPENGRYINNSQSHVTCGTGTADERHELCNHAREDSSPNGSRVIRMITQYSITYDDAKVPPS